MVLIMPMCLQKIYQYVKRVTLQYVLYPLGYKMVASLKT
jgi:hypothetical protein